MREGAYFLKDTFHQVFLLLLGFKASNSVEVFQWPTNVCCFPLHFSFFLMNFSY